MSGERLVACLRPGLELVVSPHKSVAELGVIGRAEDMHQIVDAERDATMAYLDDVVMDRGGRRGRAQERTPTGGLYLGGVPPCHHQMRIPVSCRPPRYADLKGKLVV